MVEFGGKVEMETVGETNYYGRSVVFAFEFCNALVFIITLVLIHVDMVFTLLHIAAGIMFTITVLVHILMVNLMSNKSSVNGDLEKKEGEENK